MDESNPLFSIILLVILVALSAFFSATETAFSSVNRIRLKNFMSSGDKRAKRALKIADNFDSALSAILIGNNIVNIAAASIGTLLFTAWIGASGAAVSTIVMTIVVLIFGEVLPKSFAKERPENFALTVSGILSVLIVVFTPLIWVLMQIKKMFTPKKSKSEQQPTVTEEELKFIIEEIEDEGVLDEHESELVQSALDFNDITVSEILTPRVDIVAVELTDDIETIKNVFLEEGYSRLPVYDKTIDNIIGIINEKDFFKQLLTKKTFHIKSLIQETVYVPPKKYISELLKDMQRSKHHLAVVTDQYGGTLGILSLEDIIEELVGDIWDEGDEVIHEIIKVSNDEYRVSADMNVYDLFDQLNIEDTAYASQSQSISAWALEMFEKIPEKNDSFEFENLEIKVEDVIDQRITCFIVKVK